MNTILNILRKFLGSLKFHIAPKSEAPAPVRCEFCGKPGHATEDCPDAGKYRLFSVDHDADPED